MRGAASVQILLVIVMILGLFLAIFLGNSVGNQQFIVIVGIMGVAAVAVLCLTLRTKIWLLIPLCWLLTGKIGLLPLPFTVRDMSILLALGMFLIFYALKTVPRVASLKACDLLLILNLAYLGTVFIRNPTGINALGSDMVGGRPYFDIFIAAAAYFVLQHVTVSAKESRRVPIYLSITSFIVAALGFLTMKVPSLVPIIAPIYSGISVSSYLAEETGRSTSGSYRMTELAGYSYIAGPAAASFGRPWHLFLFLRPIWSIIYYSAWAAAALGGFRTSLVSLMLFTLASSYFYAGLKDVIRISVIAALAALLVIFAKNNGVEIHPALQRGLSFLPGNWDQKILDDAQGSSQWRFEIWRIALESDKYIHNKLLGDGFGFSAYELQIQLAAMWGGTGYLNANEAETQLVSGAYHSGPISAIRYVGAVGLLFFTMLLIACAFYAWKIIELAKGTAFFPLAIFTGVPAIIKPGFFWFIFGGFDQDYPNAIFTLAILNLTHRSLVAFKASAVPVSNAPALPTLEANVTMPPRTVV
ncbi:hypothetical protein BH09VER1_BH09VER1_00130 [soil metagenome]